MHEVIVAPATDISPKRLAQRTGGGSIQWAYLGKSPVKARAMAEGLGSAGVRIEIGDALQRVARSLREDFLEYVGALGKDRNSRAWWAGSLAEKNPYVSDLFLHLCYAHVALDLIVSRSGSDPLLLLAENTALRTWLADRVGALGIAPVIRIEPAMCRTRAVARRVGAFLAHKGWFLANGLYRIAVAKIIRPSRLKPGMPGQTGSADGWVLLHTWVDGRSFPSDGQYASINFGRLADVLRAKGEKVAVVPYVLPGFSFARAMSLMRSARDQFLVPFESLTLIDVLRILVRNIFDPPRRGRYPDFNGLDISNLVHESQIQDWMGHRVLDNLLFFEAVRAWRKPGLEVKAFIFPYENHAWEKMYCLAFRKFYPGIPCVGYQNGTVPSMLLNFFFSRAEVGLRLLPHRVVTNGRFYTELLARGGYDREMLVSGGAIRFEHLWRQADIPTGKRTGDRMRARPGVLVALSIGSDEAAELTLKICEAFRGATDYRVLIKPHPSMPLAAMSRRMGRVSLPDHIVVSNAKVTELLQEVDVVLYTDSTVALEALMRGIPVVHVGSDLKIDCDLLDVKPHLRLHARSTNEILECVRRALTERADEGPARKSEWRREVAEMLAEPTEATYGLFLPERFV